MARRLISMQAETPVWLRSDCSILVIDDRLEISMQSGILTDSWTGDVQVTVPCYKVTRFKGDPASESHVYGVIRNEADIHWLRQAILSEANGVRITKTFFRLHEIGVEKFGMPTVHTVKALTGDDATMIIQRNSMIGLLQNIRAHWWQTGWRF